MNLGHFLLLFQSQDSQCGFMVGLIRRLHLLLQPKLLNHNGSDLAGLRVVGAEQCGLLLFQFPDLRPQSMYLFEMRLPQTC